RPRSPDSPSLLHAPVNGFQLPAGTEFVTVIAEHIGYWQDHGLRTGAVGINRSPDVRMLDAAGEGRREDLWIGDPTSDIAAPVRNVTGREAIDACCASGRVELSGVLQVPDAALVHLLGDPAFVPDVRVPAALVERGKYALDFGRAVACDGQPGALHVV